MSILNLVNSIKCSNVRKVEKYLQEIPDISYDNHLCFRISLLIGNTYITKLLINKGVDFSNIYVFQSLKHVTTYDYIKMFMNYYKLRENLELKNLLFSNICDKNVGWKQDSIELLMDNGVEVTLTNIFDLCTQNNFNTLRYVLERTQNAFYFNRAYEKLIYKNEVDVIKFCVKNGVNTLNTDLSEIRNTDIKEYIQRMQYKQRLQAIDNL